MKTELTPELVEKLVKVHTGSRDFRNATAVACGVHPATLSKWLTRGVVSENDEPYSSFALRFMQAETDIRTRYLCDMLDSEDRAHVSAIQWYLERRFKQWGRGERKDPEHEALDVLEATQTKGGLTPEQRMEAIAKWFAKPTPQLIKILHRAGWRKETDNGQEEEAS